MAAALGAASKSVRVAELDLTDQVWTAIERGRSSRQSGVVPTFKGSWSSESYEGLREIAQALRGNVPSESVFLFRALSRDCGAVILDSRQLFEHLFKLVTLGQEDVLAAIEGGTPGLHLSFDTERMPGQPSRDVYVLELWGGEWLKAAGMG
jgi:hypothetical protein